MVADHTSRFMTKLFLTMTGAYKKRFKKRWAVKSGSLALQVAKKTARGTGRSGYKVSISLLKPASYKSFIHFFVSFQFLGSLFATDSVCKKGNHDQG
jgi:hypothetical protein